MKKKYHTIRKQGKVNEQELATFLTKNGQGLLPMVDLIEQSRMACDQLIDVTGRAVLQAVLQLSAAQVAGGPQQQGKRRSASVVFYGRQAGQVMLSDRKLQVERPRLRTKGQGRSKEVEIPAYAAMQDQSPLGERMLDTLLRGVSTRNYKDVIPQMAETVGVSKSSVSRQAIEASEAELEALLSRRFDDLKLLIIYMDGVVFGNHTMIGAVGVDVEGRKHVLGIREGATENATVVMELLQDIVTRGVDPQQKRLFVIDGSKALRAAINAVFGADQPVQRCRAHKLRNVLDHLPDEQKEQVKSLMRAAWKMEAKAGMARIRKLAEWLEREYPSAAGSLLEGLEECFTINRLGLPPSLQRCLATTNIIESPHAGVRIRTRRVTKWLNGPALDGFSLSEDREELPQDHGVSRTLDPGRNSERIAVRHSTGSGVVTSTQPPLATFNYARDILPPCFSPRIAVGKPQELVPVGLSATVSNSPINSMDPAWTSVSGGRLAAC